MSVVKIAAGCACCTQIQSTAAATGAHVDYSSVSNITEMRLIRYSQLLSACLLIAITAITTLTITSLWTVTEQTLPVLEEPAIRMTSHF